MMKKIKVLIEHTVEDPLNAFDPSAIKSLIESAMIDCALAKQFYTLGTYTDAEVVSITYEEVHDTRA